MSLSTLFRTSTFRRARTATTAAAMTLLAATMPLPGVGGAAHAQTTDPPGKPNVAPTTSPIILQPEKQSPVDPFPNGGGNAQNRSWAAGDVLWGVMDADVPWYEPVLARSGGNGLITFDGWTFPRVTDYFNSLGFQLPSTDPNYNASSPTAIVMATAFADGELPSGVAPAPVSGTTFAAAGVSTTSAAPGSTNIVSKDGAGNPDYYEALAFPRPATNALLYNANDKFVWRLDNPTPALTATFPTTTIPGAAGTQNRYRITVHIPTPNTPVDTITFGAGQFPENRIDDARYTVYYYIKVGTNYEPRQLVCSLISQISGGDYELVAADGSEPAFPLFSSATFSAKGVATGVALPAQPTYADGAGNIGTPTTATPILQGVAIDNTTGDSGTGQVQFVLADSITLTPSTAIVSATPTVTPEHGGRKTPVTGTGAASIPTLPKTFLPDSPDANYNATATANIPHMDDTNGVFGDGSKIFSYANDINDPQYTSGMYANYGNYTPWDVSTYFMGPRSLIDPRYIGTDRNGNTFAAPGAQVGPVDPYVSDRPTLNIYANPADLTQTISRAAASVDATNNGIYGFLDTGYAYNTDTTRTHPAPYFSHAQVIIEKTEFVQDPETGVSDADKTGVKTIPVGEIYALDWQTGAPVWRFPDRTYLPTGATLNKVLIPGAGLRNPQIGTDPIQKVPVFLVPGVVAVDRNGDGKISDDEVFLGTTQEVGAYTITAGQNASGGAVNASVTIAPRVLVQGDVQVPVHDLTWTPATAIPAAGAPSDLTSVVSATPGRYYVPGTNKYNPVPVGMAFIAAGNGVMYAVDAYGNNDTRYFAGTTIPTVTTVGATNFYAGGTYFGTYQPGTTNVFWTFSNANHPQQLTQGSTAAETTLTYDQRVMGEVPGTSSFGGSSPVLAWNLTDSEMAQTMPPATPELRLFVGNTNGVLYAMDPTAKAGYITMKDPMTGMLVNTGVQSLPYIKGGQTDVANYYGAATVQAVNGTNDLGATYQSELKWWYRTQGGAINYSPAVSLYRHDQSSIGNGQIEKGVYISSSEGRIYCVDWDGPADLSNNLARLGLFDGSAGTADGFNNDYFFHNTMPAFNNGVADDQQGHVRPRWTYPNLYRTNTAADANNKVSVAADPAIGTPTNSLGGALLAEPQSLGPIQTAPVLMDFWWQDPDAGGAPTLMDYVAFVANDTEGAAATTSRVYLLDQIGDRVDFLTNPRVSGTGSAARAISQPRDRYNPSHLLASTNATVPAGLAWTYRYQYDAYETTGATPIVQDANAVQLRNMPLFDQIGTGTSQTINISTNTYDPFVIQTLPGQYYGQAATASAVTAYIHQPSRRMLPTLFAGGAGEVYALDIDPETGVFMRWRPNVQEQSLFTVLNSRMLQGLDPYPGDPTTTGTMSTLDQLSPLDHVFDATTGVATGGFGYSRSALGTQEIFARVTHLDSDQSDVTSITVTGGPTQNRSNIIPENGAAAPTEPTIPSQPTNDLPNLMQFQTGIATVVPSSQIGGGGTVTHGNGSTAVTVDPNGLPAHTTTGGSATVLPLGGHLTNFVNQDINDGVTTTAGRIGSNPQSSPVAQIHNAAFQAPILIVSTVGAANSFIHGLSTMIEGEDRVSPLVSAATNPANLGAANDSHLIGWSIASPGNESRANASGQINLFTIEGPGGTAGAAVFTNAYFPATDPYATSYRNTTASSLSANPNSDLDEPNTTAPTPSGPGVGVIDPDDPTHPRPDFKPRPYVFNQPANTGTTPIPDAHTGLTGFPLSLNGLFFDRQYAGAGAAPGAAATQFPNFRTLNSNLITKYVGGTFGYSATGNYNNDGQHPLGDYHVWPRLPGYSNIGTQLANTATNTYNGTTYNYFDINNQTPDGIRTKDLFGGVMGVDARLPALPVGANTAAGDQISDDINPSGQDVAWFYTGSSNGVVYAYTPAIVGHDTGLEGGNILYGANSVEGGGSGNYAPPGPNDGALNGSNPRVGIYSQTDLNNILSGLATGAGNTPIPRAAYGSVPDAQTWPKLSIAAKNGKNYYEWGETVYILVYDALARPYTANLRRFQRFIPTIPVSAAGIPQGGIDQSIRVTVSTINGNVVNNPTVSLEGVNYLTDGGGRLLEYYYDSTPGQNEFKIYDPAAAVGSATAPPANATPLGVAVYKYVLGANPSNSNTQTPGALLEVSVIQNAQGATTAIAAAGTGDEPGSITNPDSFFSIANPLAVQGFLTASVGGKTVTVNPASIAGEYHSSNIAGPFEANPDQFTAGTPKQDDATKQSDGVTILDPSQQGAEYWQALTNGNTIRRIDTRVFITKTDPTSGTAYQYPQRPGSPIRVNGAGVEPAFYMPVATSTGYINPATSGSTAAGNTDPNRVPESLRFVNRSLVLTALPKVRVAPIDEPSDFQFRAWPAKVMNADADATTNTRITPVGMDTFGRINPLPWEAIPAEARPWSPSTYANNSLDYPDIPGRRKNALQILSPSGDLTTTIGSLPGNVLQSGTTYEALNENEGVSANVTMPSFQPANLVQAQELTSTYQAANPLDYSTSAGLGAGVTLPASVPPGPLQMPRGVQNRLLTYKGNQVVTPFGYTARVVAFIDSDGSQRLNPATSRFIISGGSLNGIQSVNQAPKTYREFEIWTGVPVDQSLRVVESVIDLGALAQGFSEQNGLLGYSTSATDASGIGLTPLNSNYSGYFKTFTVQNTGNVNDYNARASQRTESTIYGDGTGSSYSYFLLHSPTVDPRFGILAVGPDPALPGIGTKLAANVMPQIVTSLDPILDTLWDKATETYLNSVLPTVGPDGNTAGEDVYKANYQQFAGHHAIPKALPNSTSASILGIPAQPVASSLVSGVQLASIPPAVAVALPLGTPVGVYSSNLGSSPFTIFEDHDTPNYNPLPYVTSTGSSLAPTISPAGPLYHGQNSGPTPTSPIYPVYSGGTATAGEGIWRAQSVSQGTYGNANYVPPTFLPYAYPYLTIKAAVTEDGLTGQFPDLATATTPSINTGVLPSIDPFPVVTPDSTAGGTTFYRPSAALTPAVWRDSNGLMHIYYSRNDTASSGTNPGGAKPGAPYALYHSSLNWNNKIGVWQADTTGSPVATPGAAAGHWLKSPVVLPTSGAINSGVAESNTSPFVLTHTTATSTASTNPVTVDAATLFFTDSTVNPNGSTRNRIFFTDVTQSNGDGGTASEYFTNADSSFARYAPRAAFAPLSGNDGMDELMYYGGAAGRWSIYYVPRTATKGLPTGTAPDASATQGVEKTLAMPSAIVSSSEPSPVYRQVYDVNGTLQNVVDVYFTGISKTTQTPDIYMTRYTVANDGTGVLNLMTLPPVTGESLASIGRNGVWRSSSLNWVASPAAPPTVKWTNSGTALMTVPGNWKLDPSTGILYQAVGGTPTTLTYVYVDASAGTVQFRGASAPLVTDSVTAAYTPQTYRLTSDGASNFGDFTFLDPQTLPATTTGQGNVLRRQNALLGGRDYLLWQKGAASGKSPTLYYSIRRVGVDLQVPTGQSILLGLADNTTKDQTPVVGPVTVNGTQIPFDVDFINGRVYVEPQWEGQPITVTYTLIAKGAQGPNATTPASTTKTLTGQYLDELNVGAQGNFGAALPITAGINEGQAAAFIDLYDWVGLGNSRKDPPSVSTSGAYDPTLTPGRTWIFWTSPRGRTGQTTVPDPYPSGFNLYWETIAPNFEGSAIYSITSHS